MDQDTDAHRIGRHARTDDPHRRGDGEEDGRRVQVQRRLLDRSHPTVGSRDVRAGRADADAHDTQLGEQRRLAAEQAIESGDLGDEPYDHREGDPRPDPALTSRCAGAATNREPRGNRRGDDACELPVDAACPEHVDDGQQHEADGPQRHGSCSRTDRTRVPWLDTMGDKQPGQVPVGSAYVHPDRCGMGR